jgi:hypothetical protein
MFSFPSNTQTSCLPEAAHAFENTQCFWFDFPNKLREQDSLKEFRINDCQPPALEQYL